MNFVSKFDGVVPFTGTHPKAQTHVDTVHTKAPADAIVVEDANLLFNGDFKRSGIDLVISKDDHELVLADYFKGEKRAPLASPDGAWLAGKTIDALTGHVQMAQADGSATTAKIIGHVTKLSGNATVIRNGVSIILNNGDNVHQGDVVQCGSNSTLGITFIDGSVFGLGSNAKMVLNEMVYDPNGSSNSSFLSLVQGTISFVAGATAKHGDMKVDTPVATMGIRGTAVLVEIDFEVGPSGGAPPARFQVLVEPDGTTGSYVLLDRVTLAPIATVNQAGTVTTVSGQGTVSFLASAQLSPEVMKLITEVFSQKFTDNTNPKSNTNFTDSPVPEITFPVKFASGDTGTATIRVIPASEAPSGPTTSPPKGLDHIPGPPDVVTFNKVLAERTALTGSSLIDATSGGVTYSDVNIGDVPTVSTAFHHFGYQNAASQNVTSTLTAAQLSAIAAVSVPLVVVQDPAAKNTGTATWTYNVQDHALDFLAEGETLTLTYMARVDNNFHLNNEFALAPFTITITGTNDTPTIASPAQAAAIEEQSGTVDSNALDTATGKIEFEDADLTDTHNVSITGVAIAGTTSGLADHDTVLGWLTLGTLTDSTDGVTGSSVWTFSAQDHYFDYLAEDETVTLTYTVEVEDNNGATVTQDVVVTVTGTNDAPELAADTSGNAGLHSIVEQAGVTGVSTSDTASGSLTFRDVDLSDTHTVSVSVPVFNWVNSYSQSLTVSQVNGLTAASTFTPTLHDSTGTGNGSIDFSYSIEDYYFDFLAEDETLTITYQVTVTDEHNVTSTRPVTITVTGTNDAPVAVADSDSGHIVEAGHDENNDPVAGTATTAGNVLANDTDVDLTDTHQVVGVTTGTSTGILSGNVGTSIKGTYGWLKLNADGTWTYTLDNDDPDTNALPEGAQVSDVFSYTQSDLHGGTATTTLTINITGTNDEPEANAAPVAATDVNEGDPIVEQGVGPGNTPVAGVASATGNVLANDYDVDTGDTKAVQGVASGTANGPLTGQVGDTIHGTYGMLILNANGTWTYTLDNDNPVTQALTQDEHVTDVFTYTMHDTLGSTSSATLTIAVTGTNDAPTLEAENAGTLTDTAASDSFDDLTGTLASNDVDSGETATLYYAGFYGSEPTNDPVVGLYGSLTVNADGSYVYVSDAAAINALGEGSYEDTFTVQTIDEHGAIGTATLTVNVTGANDTPTLADLIAGTLTDTAASDSFDDLTGTLAGNDADEGETATLYYAGFYGSEPTNDPVVGLYGSLTVNDDGSYVYVSDAAAINALGEGSYEDTFTVQTIDEHGAVGTATLTVNVTGANDTPTLADLIAGTLTDTVASDGFGDLTGTLAGNDADAGETATLYYAGFYGSEPTNDPVAGLYGSLTVNADGSYVYVADAATINALGAGTYEDTFTVQTIDAHGAIGTATLTVNVTGANDAPVITSNGGSATASVSVAENTTAVTTVQAADVDNANLTYSIVNGEDSPDADKFTINASTGALSFVAAPDYEAPGSDVESNVYTVQVQVADGAGGHDIQTLTVAVTDVEEQQQPTISFSTAAFTTIDVPDVGNELASGINDDGTIVGSADLSASSQVGWVYDGTTFTTLIAPDTNNAQDTAAHAINEDGIIVGDYSPVRSTPRYGFSYGNGHYTQIASDSPYPSTNANGINDAGIIVGNAYLHTGTRYSGYVYDGTFTYLSAPGANNSNGDTFANDINNLGQVAGTYNPNASNPYGYLGYVYDGSTYTTIADPSGERGTNALGLNDHGQVVGFYTDGSGVMHGFVESGGIYTTIDNPLGVNGTVVTGINNAGHIVGYYLDGNNVGHAFESSVNSTVTAENTELVLSNISVDAPELTNANDTVEVSLDVDHGTLELNDTTGLSVSFSAGHDTVTLTGTVADINAALARGVVYDPATDYNGSDELEVTINDLGHNAANTPQSTTDSLDLSIVHAVTGTTGADDLASTSANDYLTGGAGADNFTFEPNLGEDTIADYTPGTDSITFNQIFTDATELLAATHDDGNGNAVITIDANNSITLQKVSQAQLAAHPSDFHFV